MSGSSRAGFTGNQEIPIAKSIVDYIFRWLGSRFLLRRRQGNLGLIDRSAVVADAPASSPGSAAVVAVRDRRPLGRGSAAADPTPATRGLDADRPTATEADAPKADAPSRPKPEVDGRRRPSSRSSRPTATRTVTPPTATARMAGGGSRRRSP